MSWKPGVYDIHFVREDDWEQFFTLRDKATQVLIDTTGWTGRSQVRAAHDGQMIAELTVTPGDNGFLVTATKIQSKAIADNLAQGVGVWDLELTNATGFTRTWLKGAVTTEKDATHDA